MNKKFHKPICFVFLMIIFAFFVNAAYAQEGTAKKAASQSTPFLAGKTIWIVDVNTTEKYKSTFQEALMAQLPKAAPKVILKHVLTSEKGNPFFMLKQKDAPDAVIICLGVCEATTRNVANYASEAKKKSVPAVIIYDDFVRDMQQARNTDFRNPEQAGVEIHGMPETMETATPVAQEASPALVEKLTQLLKG